jgi:hypothetical protein
MLAGCAVTLGALFCLQRAQRVFVYGDLGSFLLPMRIFSRRASSTASRRCGCRICSAATTPTASAIGIFHPLRWLLYRFLPVSEAFNLECRSSIRLRWPA